VLAGWRGCYGVVLQGDRCVAVRAERVRGRVVCSPVDGGAIERIASEGLPVVTVMSERESFTRWVEAPYGSPAKARKVFPTLLDIQLPFALDDCIHSFIDLTRTPDHHCRGLAAAARRTHVAEKLAACEARGFDPMVLDQAGPALWTQALQEHPPRYPGASRLVVWLEDTHATLVKGTGNEFASAHTVRAADIERMRHLVGAPMTDTDTAQAEWIWCGPAATPDHVAALWQALGEPGERQTVDDPATFLARAIATRALLAGPYRCNLRCGSLTHAALRHREKRSATLTLSLALSAALLLALADGVVLWRLRSRIESVESAVSAEIDALAGYHVTARGRDALRSVQDAIQERKDELAPFVAALQPSLLTQVGSIVQAADRNGAHIESLLLDAQRVELTGTAPDWRRCETLLPIMGGSLSNLKRGEALVSERIPFTIATGGHHE